MRNKVDFYKKYNLGKLIKKFLLDNEELAFGLANYNVGFG